ncbi:ISSfl4 ORF3 [Shigella sonnei]|nr:ISSfl4 ORF3 [Shigella sonnei]
MNDISSDDIFLLKQRLAEQEALIHALQEKLSNREREIDHLQAQLDKLRRMNFGSRSEKVSRRIAQMEADLNRCVRPAPVSRSLNHYPVTKSDCCLRRRAARTAAVH